MYHLTRNFEAMNSLYLGGDELVMVSVQCYICCHWVVLIYLVDEFTM